MDRVLSLLADWPPALIYLVTAVVAAAETGTLLGLLVPGEITLLVVGFLCWQGVLRLPVALAAMIVAGLVGDSFGYLHGRRTGHRLRTSRLGRRVSERRWARTDALLRRHGGRAVFLCRYLGFARTLAPRLVGMSMLGYRTFLAWDILGVVGCVGGTVLVGYAAGRSYATAAGLFGRATDALLALTVLIVVLVLVGRYLGRNPDPVAALAKRIAGWPPLRFVGRAYRSGFGWLAARVGTNGAVAVNILGGVLVLLFIGYALTWTVDRLVRHSGLPLVDPPVVEWMKARREPRLVVVATDLLSVLRGSYLMILVGLAAAGLSWHYRGWRANLVGLLGTGGAIVPLALIALATDWERRAGMAAPAGRLGNQIVVVAASLGMLAWLLSRRFGWICAVASWTIALGIVVLVAAARVYVGWSWPSEAVASTLLGSLWVLVFAVAWHTHDEVSDRVSESAVKAATAPAQR